MAVSDIFPATPQYPIEDDPVDRKVRLRMKSGRLKTWSQGNDFWRAELHGETTGIQLLALKAFHEMVGQDVFTLVDKSFPSGDINRICVFAGVVRSRLISYNKFAWSVMIEENAGA